MDAEAESGKATIDRQIGRLLRRRRLELGLTQQELSQSIGVSDQQLDGYERGNEPVAAAILWALSEALQVNIKYFFQEVELGRLRAMAAKKLH